MNEHRAQMWQLSGLLAVGLISGFALKYGVVYRSLGMAALTTSVFYRTWFDWVLLLSVLPYLVCRAVGACHSGISRLMQGEPREQTHFSVAWALCLFLVYSLYCVALIQNRHVMQLSQSCMDQSSSPQRCHRLAIRYASKLESCGYLLTASSRQTCVERQLTQWNQAMT